MKKWHLASFASPIKGGISAQEQIVDFANTNNLAPNEIVVLASTIGFEFRINVMYYSEKNLQP
jgi:phosphopantothenate synthetase